jgi:hypothetical protein
MEQEQINQAEKLLAKMKAALRIMIVKSIISIISLIIGIYLCLTWYDVKLLAIIFILELSNNLSQSARRKLK